VSPLIFIAWVAVGIVVGAYGTLVGAGGGFAMVPILLLVYPQQSPAQLTAVSLGAVFANVISGSIGYARLKRIDYRTGLTLAPATIPGAIIGALVVGAIPRVAFDRVMGSALILVSAFLLLRPHGSIPLGLNSRWVVSRTLVDSDGKRYQYRFNLALAIVASFGIGFVSSLLGIGGGIVQVPILTSFFGFPAHLASATSQFVQIFTSGFGTLTHIFRGDYASFVGVTIALAVGVIIGAQIGAAISRRVAGSSIIRLLAVALGLVGIRLVLLQA
jgi:uncharacterized membrane protein YfcA